MNNIFLIIIFGLVGWIVSGYFIFRIWMHKSPPIWHESHGWLIEDWVENPLPLSWAIIWSMLIWPLMAIFMLIQGFFRGIVRLAFLFIPQRYKHPPRHG